MSSPEVLPRVRERLEEIRTRARTRIEEVRARARARVEEIRARVVGGRPLLERGGTPQEFPLLEELRKRAIELKPLERVREILRKPLGTTGYREVGETKYREVGETERKSPEATKYKIRFE